MAAKKTFGNGYGRIFINSHFINLNRQDAISRVLAVQNSVIGPNDRTDGLSAETRGHINLAGCEGVATTVTAAHDSIGWHLYDIMHAAQKPKKQAHACRA